VRVMPLCKHYPAHYLCPGGGSQRIYGLMTMNRGIPGHLGELGSQLPLARAGVAVPAPSARGTLGDLGVPGENDHLNPIGASEGAFLSFLQWA
jgi:hypothetical protein